MRAAIVAVFALCLSCARTANVEPLAPTFPADTVPSVTPIFVDSAFDASTRSEIEESIDFWNYALHGYRVLYLAGVLQNPLGAALPANAWTITFNETAPPPPEIVEGAIAWATAVGSGEIHLTPNGEKLGVILHEMGHSLGLGHLAGTVMDPVDSGKDCLDWETLSVLAAVSGWDWRTLRPTCP